MIVSIDQKLRDGHNFIARLMIMELPMKSIPTIFRKKKSVLVLPGQSPSAEQAAGQTRSAELITPNFHGGVDGDGGVCISFEC